MFLVFLSFCLLVDTDVERVQVPTVLLFIEYLSQNGLLPSSIRNYMCGIQVFFKWFGLNTEPLNHFKVSLMYKALDQFIETLNLKEYSQFITCKRFYILLIICLFLIFIKLFTFLLTSGFFVYPILFHLLRNPFQ